MADLMSGKWKGTFTYGAIYPKKAGTSVVFELELEAQDGYFKGRCKEELLPPEQHAIISGFIDDTFVSFIKKYPYYLGTDEQGNIIPVHGKAPHNIHYAGNIGSTTIEGVFELGNKASFVHSDEIREGGHFRMTKE